MYFFSFNKTIKLLSPKTLQSIVKLQKHHNMFPIRTQLLKSKIIKNQNALLISRGILSKIGTSSSSDPSNPKMIDNKEAQSFAMRLTVEDRKTLIKALQDVEGKRIREEYEGQLAAHRWTSKFGRPSKVPKIGDVDPTGTYCAVPEEWLSKKTADVSGPSTKDLLHLAIANSIPFIGFGFLDNFIMIVAGDYIDHVLGSYICLSTMAAAALGNTLSDVAGIGSAFYVERFAGWIGFQSPKLDPTQLEMSICRRFSNLGRVVGITLGCLLGMLPLLFITEEPKQSEEQPESPPVDQDIVITEKSKS